MIDIRTKSLGLAVMLLSLVGCQSMSGSKYKPEQRNEGYSQSQQNSILTATFKGSSQTDPEKALMFSNLRAVEICRELGHKIALPLSTKDQTQTEMIQKSTSSQSPNSPFSSPQATTEKRINPVFETTFVCANKSNSSEELVVREVSAKEMERVVSDLLGGIQVMTAPTEKDMDSGDFIIRVDGKRVQTVSDYILALQGSDQKVKLTIVRDGKMREISVQVKENTKTLLEAQTKMITKACLIEEIKQRNICSGGKSVAKIESNNLGQSVTEVAFVPKESVSDIVEEEKYNYVSPSAASEKWKFGIGVGYLFNSSIKGTAKATLTMPNSPAMTGSNGFSGSMKKAIQFSVNVRKMPEYSSGFMGSFEITPVRDEEDGSISLSSYLVKGNYALRAESVYLFLGPNLSFHQATDNMTTPFAGGKKTSEATGGLGFQLGFGGMINNNVALEVEFEEVKFDYSSQFSTISGPAMKQDVKLESFISNFKIGLKGFF